MIYDQADEVFKEFFESFLKRYQSGFGTLKKGGGFFFDCVNSWH